MRRRPILRVAFLVALGVGFVVHAGAGAAEPSGRAPDLALWNGARAMGDIARQLSFGSRALDTPGHEREIQFIVAELRRVGLTVERQTWSYATDRGIRTLSNLIARLAPDNPDRVVVGTHYDSIARAYRDKKHPDAVMPGANNSASGVALLLETARVLAKSRVPPTVGIDLVFFDGEEGPISLGEGDPNWRALGSPYFAAHLGELYPRKNPMQSVIFDMVCYRDLKLHPEPISLASAGNEVRQFWALGRRIAPAIFVMDPARTWIWDDQVALAKAGIPSFLVIGFDYAPWFNTTQDTLDKCSARSLDAVGRTLLRYLYLQDQR
jgi:Zn-dependent M28 family amino/carboxypeptidase